jgi:hypothetical protein
MELPWSPYTTQKGLEVGQGRKSLGRAGARPQELFQDQEVGLVVGVVGSDQHAEFE